MSANFMQKVPRDALPNAQEMNAQDAVPWYLRYSARVVATIGGILSIALGAVPLVYNLATIDIKGVVSVLLTMLFGFLVLVIEAPFMVSFLSWARRPGEFLENAKTPFAKALLYIVFGVLPLMISFSTVSFFGSALVFLAGIIHAVIAFGRKAPLEQMQAAAGGGQASQMENGGNVY